MLAIPALNRHLPWREVLRFLNLPHTAPQLPLEIPCPRCQSRLSILPDRVTGGQWHWCADCGQQGDLVGLAAWMLDVSPEAAAMQLRLAGLLDDLSLEEVGRLGAEHQTWRTLQEFWDACRKDLIVGRHPAALGALSAQLYWSDNHVLRFPETIGPLLGTAECLEVERLFCPGSVVRDQPTQRFRNTSASRIFRGAGWTQTAVVPLSDLPGRTCGFLFLGREGDLGRDVRHRLPAYYPGTGIVVHPRTWQPEPRWNERIIAMPDPWLMLRLHTHYARQSLMTLPLVAWEPSLGSPEHVWPALPSAVFWHNQLTPQLLWQAALADGKIALAGPRESTREAWLDYLGRFTALDDLMAHVFSRARPWTRVLDQLASAADQRFEQLLLDCLRAGFDLQRLLPACGPRTQERGKFLLPRDPARHGVAVQLGRREFEVRETADGYVAHSVRGQPHPISSGRMELDCVLHDRETGRVQCQGTLLFHDQRVRFRAPLERIEQGGFGWLRKRLLKAGLGVLNFDHRWKDHLLHLALEFHHPPLRHVSSRVGYDRDRRCFQLPAGNLTETGFERTEAIRIPGRRPAETLRFPTRLDVDDLTQLASPAYPEFLWQLILGLCTQLVESIYLPRPSNLALLSNHFDERVVPVLGELGCLTLPVWRNNRRAIETVKAASQQHDWPLAVGGRFPSRRWPEFRPRLLVAHQNPWNALCRQLEGSWHVLPAAAPEDLTPQQIRAAQHLLTAWLADLAAKQFRAQGITPTEVATQLGQVMGQMHAQPGSLDRAVAAGRWGTDAGDPLALAALLRALLGEGSLQLLPWGTTSRQPALWHHQSGSRERLWIPVVAIERLLKRRNAAWNRRQVARVLQQHQLRRRCPPGYWSVPMDWWRDASERTEAEGAKLAIRQ